MGWSGGECCSLAEIILTWWQERLMGESNFAEHKPLCKPLICRDKSLGTEEGGWVLAELLAPMVPAEAWQWGQWFAHGSRVRRRPILKENSWKTSCNRSTEGQKRSQPPLPLLFLRIPWSVSTAPHTPTSTLFSVLSAGDDLTQETRANTLPTIYCLPPCSSATQRAEIACTPRRTLGWGRKQEQRKRKERGGRDRGMSMKSRDIKKKESNEGKVNKKIWTEE